jgi:aspartyl-tRNA(Asn)/glutamyl-tRNA(Gln) amidotransferase subunit A
MSDSDLAFAPLPALGAKLRGGEVSAVELAKFFLGRLEAYGPRYNCVVNLTREIAFEQAAKADAELKAGHDRGPLHGIPYGAKDLLATKGVPTTWGCALHKHRVIDHDATVVRKLREAGAVLVAKLSMVELAGGMGYRQANASLTGPGRNPWKPSQWSGGSSSGSGSAVSAGLVPFAIGTETWGSITTPSSYCGLTGLRPTYGRVSRAGAMALSWTLDKIGPMAHTAHDCGLVLSAIAGPDPDDPSAADRPCRYPPADAPGRPYKLAVLKGGVDRAQPEVKANFDRALELFKSLGSVTEVELPDLPFGAVASTVLAAEKASAFEEMLESGEVFKLTAPEDRIGGFSSQAVLATDYLRAQRIRAKLCRALDDWLAPFDAVLTVPTGGTAPTADGPFDSRHGHKSMGGPGNACGTPAIVLPTGLTKDGLPTALQLDGRAYSENRLLALAVAYQTATSWHTAQPDLGSSPQRRKDTKVGEQQEAVGPAHNR